MAKKEHYDMPFEAGSIYHIYNRSIDRKPLFVQDRNYVFFLNKLDFYLSSFIDIYAWCLMSNHFHLMARVKDLEDFRKHELSKLTTFQKLPTLETVEIEKLPTLEDVPLIVSHAFQKMFQSYAMAFNKQENRVGSLFQSPLKRNKVESDEYFTNLVYYIHANAQLHGFVDDFRQYPWSSYNRIILPKPSKLQKEKVLGWFGGVDQYIDYHSSNPRILESGVVIEDD
jgi:putative transposase